MPLKKIINKIAFGLISLTLMMLLGIGICSYLQVRKVPRRTDPEIAANSKSKENIVSRTVETSKKKAGVRTYVSDGGENHGVNDIEDISKKLYALEKELDTVYNRMIDESKKIELLKGQIEKEKRRLEDPKNIEILREVRKETLSFQYEPLLDNLNLSPDKQEKLMKIILDEQMASLKIGMIEIDDPVEGNKIVSSISHCDIGNEYQIQIREILDYDSYNKYQKFKESFRKAY